MLATSLLQGLKDHGAREIFGIPGDFVLPFFKVIEDSGILPHYTLSHEPGVGFAADAAARYHAGLGVDRAGLVMDPEAAAALARARSPGDDDDRGALGICAGNGVD
jgi:glyoxylate carboligase